MMWTTSGSGLQNISGFLFQLHFLLYHMESTCDGDPASITQMTWGPGGRQSGGWKEPGFLNDHKEQSFPLTWTARLRTATWTKRNSYSLSRCILGSLLAYSTKYSKYTGASHVEKGRQTPKHLVKREQGNSRSWSGGCERAAVIKHRRLRGFNSRHLLLTILEAGKPTIKEPVDSVPGENSPPGLQKAAFSLCFHLVGRRSSGLSSSSHKDTNFISNFITNFIISTLMTSSNPNHFLKAPPHWEVELQHMNGGRGTNIQSITGGRKEDWATSWTLCARQGP